MMRRLIDERLPSFKHPWPRIVPEERAVADGEAFRYAKNMHLDVSNIACTRTGRPVLDGVTFSVQGGEVLALRGPNGSGKSTLLRILAGLLPHSAGSATLGGVDLGRNFDHFTAQIAYSGHLDAIKPQLTVLENLRFWAALFGADDASTAMEAFELGAISDRPAHACSAGQKRRLGLARLALTHNRPLWLLDEPTVSLDTAASAMLFRAVRIHCEVGGAAIIATHVPLDLPRVNEFRLTPQSEARPRSAMSADPFLEGLLP